MGSGTRVLRDIIGHKGDKVTEKRRRVHEELDYLHSWARHVAHLGKGKGAYRVGETRGKEPIWKT